jgi:hypothetical protein
MSEAVAAPPAPSTEMTDGVDPKPAEMDLAWELARKAIALRTPKGFRMHPSSPAGAEEADFTETQISDAMRQLPRNWKKREDGFWEEAETVEEKRVRAMEVLREAGTQNKPSSTVDAEQADFTETQISDAMQQLPRGWKKREDGFWEDESAEEKRARAMEVLREAATKPTTAAVVSSAAPKSAVAGVVVPTEPPKPKSEKAPKEAQRAAWKEGIFAPLVVGAKQVMGAQELKEFRAGVIAKHSKVIGQFVDTSESEFGQLVLKRMFEYADKDGNGTLDKEEVRIALLDLGFDFLDEKQVEKLIKNADKDQNDVIDFEEFVKATPKALRINLVKLAKKNGHDLGFLV